MIAHDLSLSLCSAFLLCGLAEMQMQSPFLLRILLHIDIDIRSKTYCAMTMMV